MSLDDKIKNILKKQKILPIINTTNLDEDLKKIDNLISQKKNIQCLEITLRNENSLIIAKEIKNNFPNITIGLGSITNVKQFEGVVDYQFDFFVSPGIIDEIINLNAKNYIPGAESISEFNYLLNKDVKIIKFFPAMISGGVGKLNSIASIFKELNFIPTGGINESNVHSFLELQNVLCVGTSKFNDLIS